MRKYKVQILKKKTIEVCKREGLPFRSLFRFFKKKYNLTPRYERMAAINNL